MASRVLGALSFIVATLIVGLLVTGTQGGNVYKLLRKSASGAGLELCEEGLEYLRSIKDPVALVTIVGPTRSGKSLTLNRVTGDRNGFAVGSGLAHKTNGVDAWGEPIRERSANKSVIVLLDTEGLGHSVKNYDRAILLFSVLTSSKVILNLNHNINNQDIDNLYTVAHLVDNFMKTSNESVQFPLLMWLVQKYTLSTENIFKPLRTVLDQYLGEIPNPDNDPQITNRNYTVKTIKKCFNRQAALFVPPATKNVDYFSKLSNLDRKYFDKEYLKEMDALRDFISKTLPIRKNETSGADLAEYIENIMPLVNNNTDGGLSIVEQFSHNACRLCFQEFVYKMRNITLPLEDHVLENIYQEAKKASLDCFDRNMPFGAQSYVVDNYRMILSNRDESFQEKVLENNTYSSYRACMDMSRGAKTSFKSGNYATMAECKREMEQEFHNVSKRLRGPWRKECLRVLYSDLEGCAQNMAVMFAAERVDRLFSTLAVMLFFVGSAFYLTRHFTVPLLYVVHNFLGYVAFVLGVCFACVFLVGKTSFTGFSQSDLIKVLDMKDNILLFFQKFFIVILIGAALLLRVAFKYRPKSSSQIVLGLLSTSEGRHIDDYEGDDTEDEDDDDDDDDDIFSSDDEDNEDTIENENDVWKRRREMVFFVENCGAPRTVLGVSRLLFRRSRRRRIVLVVGWEHYLGLDFLPRNGVVHIVCSGPKRLSDACEGWVIDAASQVSDIETIGETENSNTEAFSYIYNCAVDFECMDMSDVELKKQFMRLRRHR